MTNLVFLDFDGVLTSDRVNFAQNYKASYPLWSKFDPVTIDFFNRVHYNFDVAFVWNTTWMHGMDADNTMHYHWAQTMFRNAGFQGSFADPWKVPSTYHGSIRDGVSSINYRAHEVLDYLKSYYPSTIDKKSFIVVDDNDFQYNAVLGVKRFVRTDATNGMLSKHYTNFWSLANDVFKDKS